MLRYLFFLFIPLCSIHGFGQNLVPNGSFESFSLCPGSFSQAQYEFRALCWSSANTGTPDHFHSCSNGEAGVPYNWAGVSEAFDGRGYAGIFLWMGSDRTYREYLTCELLQPLLKDSLYTLTFRYKLSSYSKYAVDRIGFFLAGEALKVNYDRPLRLEPSGRHVKDSALTEHTGLWEIAQWTYRAHGGEKYLVLGNFDDNSKTRVYNIRFRPIAEPMLAESAYYYIDDVSLVSLYADPETGPQPFSLEAETNTAYVLKNIQFAFNSARLMPESFAELDLLVEYLVKNPSLRVQVTGHTDATGSEAFNLDLSQRRASAVGEFLTGRGISPERVLIRGEGESRPLSAVAGEESDRLNRRVEVIFI